MSINTYKNWQYEVDAQNIGWLTLDCAGSSTNVLGGAVVLELADILTEISQQLPNGLLILSGKSNGFIAGANVKEFSEFVSAEEATAEVKKAQAIVMQLSKLNCTTVAMINGFCLGGGLELALACDYRVVLDTPKTRLGLPEVMLGVQPGWGGSVRLPRLIGSLKAMDLILSGRTVDARTAYKMGIVDVAVPDRHFMSAGLFYAAQPQAKREYGRLERVIQKNFMRNLVAKFLRNKLAGKVKEEHYPAPYAVVDTWCKNSIFDDSAFTAEAESIGRLIVTDTSRNLVRVFFLRDRLKALAKKQDFLVQHVHVVGAGIMGGDIAVWCAMQGFKVTVQDQDLKAIAATCKRGLELYSKKLKVPYLIQGCVDRLIPDPTGIGISHADVIIEAIIENVEAKQGLFAQLEARAKPTAILATNTSTIPLQQIGANLRDPRRVVGIHFFNPVALMQLVEVVADENTDPQVVANAISFVGRIDKLPLPVRSAPGFLVNRVLIPYLLESAALYAESVPGTAIDKAATDFGMPMGPIELMDTVGLDICVAAAKELGQEIPGFVSEWVQQGKRGKKSGEGFYKYKNGKAIKPKLDVASKVPSDLADRMIMRLLNESAACVREKIAADADLVDAGMIFGTGFAPFRGGPMHYAVSMGKPEVKQRLLELQQRYGERFTPDQWWNEA